MNVLLHWKKRMTFVLVAKIAKVNSMIILNMTSIIGLINIIYNFNLGGCPCLGCDDCWECSTSQDCNNADKIKVDKCDKG